MVPDCEARIFKCGADTRQQSSIREAVCTFSIDQRCLLFFNCTDRCQYIHNTAFCSASSKRLLPSLGEAASRESVSKKKISYSAFETKYNEKTGVLSKTLIFLFIPIYGVLFYGIFFGRKRYFVEHIVVATHLWAFILLLLALVVPAIAIVLIWWFDASSATAVIEANDNPISILLQFCIGAYLLFMFRRVYAVSYWYGMIAAALIAWSFFQIVWLYRFLLFMITLYSV